jgi:hypothetical protein
MLDDSNLNSVLALAGLSFPAEFIEAMRAYRDQVRLARLGLMTSPHEIAEFVQPSFSKWPFRGEGFLPFMHSNSNYVFVGCVQKFRGVIAANGVVLTNDLGGLTHENVHGFLGMLDATSNHEHADCIELLASVQLYDVIRDQRIIVEANQKIEELLEGDLSGAWWYLTRRSIAKGCWR